MVSVWVMADDPILSWALEMSSLSKTKEVWLPRFGDRVGQFVGNQDVVVDVPIRHKS